MPNRIIREGILTSTRVNALNWEEEVFYRRLLSYVDDFGRCEAHAALLRAALFPLKLDQMREANVERLLQSIERAGLVRLYTVQGKRFLEVYNFRQQMRSTSRHPKPPDEPLHDVCAADAQQPKANAHLGVVVVEGVVEDGDGGVGGPPKVGQRSRATVASRPETQAEVEAYFLALGSTSLESETFYDHYEANGWRQGGKTPIKDWQAAARNWVRRNGSVSRGAAAGLGGNAGGKNLLRGGGRGSATPNEEPRVTLPVAGLDEAMAEVGLGPDGQPLAGAQGGAA